MLEVAAVPSSRKKRKGVSTSTPTETLKSDIPEDLRDILYLDLKVQQLPASRRRKFGGNGCARVLTAADFIDERKKSDADAKTKRSAKPKRKGKAKAKAKGKEAKADSKVERKSAARRAKKPLSLAEHSEDDVAEQSEHSASEHSSSDSSSGGSDAEELHVRAAPRKTQLMIDDGLCAHSSHRVSLSVVCLRRFRCFGATRFGPRLGRSGCEERDREVLHGFVSQARRGQPASRHLLALAGEERFSLLSAQIVSLPGVSFV